MFQGNLQAAVKQVSGQTFISVMFAQFALAPFMFYTLLGGILLMSNWENYFYKTAMVGRIFCAK
jgi:hypothetical protein